MKPVLFPGLFRPVPWRWLSWITQGEPAAKTGEAAAGEDADHACMRRVAEGDPDALQRLFDRWKLPLISYFYRSLGSRADAEDLALVTFERAYRASGRFRPEAKFSSWLFAIARRELLHELRRRRRKPVEPVAPEELCMVGVDTQDLGQRRAGEMEEHLLSVLQELPERQRSAVLLSAAGDLSHEEVAASLKVSTNHLNVLLHRGRKALKTLFLEK